MDKTRNTYSIAGQKFDETALKGFCLEKISALGTPLWEREIYSFILKWFSPENTIDAMTSGSTGGPKTISLLKDKMVESAKATLAFFGLKPTETALLCLPVNFIAGKMMIVRALVGGLDLHYIEPSSAPDLSQIKHIDFAAMTPMQVVKSFNTKSGFAHLEKIKKLILGGSSMPFGLEENLRKVETSIWHTFGMTETITHVAVRKVNGSSRSEWFLPLPGVEIEKAENDCLKVNYPGIGVQNLVTNDVIELNKNGGFKVLGRIDSVVNSGGVKLFPELIEKKIEDLFDVEFYLAGLPDNLLGERLVLFVEGDESDQQDSKSILEKIKTKLQGFEIPKEVIFKKQFKRTGSGKLIRTVDY